MRTRFALPLVAALAVGVGAPAQAQFGKPSQADQVKLGHQAADEVRKKEKVLPTYDDRVRAVRRIGQSLVSVMDAKSRKPWDFTFDVIQSNTINAFALPGGPTFVYTGLLDKLTTEDQIAGVMAHELTHVRREHWAYQYRDQQQKGLLLNLGLLVFGANRTTAGLANIGLDVLVNLPYSRKHETEADVQGYDLMVQAGFNPMGMADVFRILQKNSGGGKPPEFLSDHPGDSGRIKRIEDKIRQSGKSFPAQTPIKF